MIRLIVLVLMILVGNPQRAYADDESQLRKLKTQLWNQAYRNQDVKLLNSILHSSFQMIDANGNRSNKVKELDYIAKNTWNPSNFSYTIPRLDIYGDIFAIVDGTGDTDTYSYQSSNVLIKEDGRWQAVSSHVSGYRSK